MNIARSSIQIFIAKIIGSVVSFVGITFFARELGASQIGAFFLFQAVLGITTIPVNFGINDSVTKRISEGESPGSILSSAILLKVLLLLPFILGILLLKNTVNDYLGADLAIYLIIALILQESANLTISILGGELRVGEIAGPTLSRKIVYVAVGGGLVLIGLGIQGVIYGFLSGLLILLLWGIWKCSITPGSISMKYVYSILNYSKYSFILSVGGYIYSWMDIAVIGYFLSQSSVGIYEISWRVTVVVMLFSQSVATTIFPQVSKWESKDKDEYIKSLLSKTITPALFISIPAFFGTVLYSREILELIFGSEYGVGWLILIILMGEKVIQSVHVILGKSLQALDRPDLAAKSTIITIILNLVLNVIFIIQFGIVGAAVATTVSFAVNSFLHAYYLSRFISIQIPYTEIVGCVLSSLGMVVTLLIFQSTVIINDIPTLLLIITLGVISYTAFVYIIPFSRDVLLENVQRVIGA
jgi:O-antigen/teichoic acid export membrane protein